MRRIIRSRDRRSWKKGISGQSVCKIFSRNLHSRRIDEEDQLRKRGE